MSSSTALQPGLKVYVNRFTTFDSDLDDFNAMMTTLLTATGSLIYSILCRIWDVDCGCGS